MAEYQQLRIDEDGDVTIAHFRQACLSDDIELEQLGQELSQLVEEEHRKKLVFNFSSVEFLSSRVLGKLVSTRSKAKARKAAMRLCNLQPQVLDVFLTCKLDRVFDIKKDLADALRSF